MATDAKRKALSWRTGAIYTVRSECHRHISFEDAQGGRIKKTGRVEVDLVGPDFKAMEICFELTVSGVPKERDGRVAFEASCATSYLVEHVKPIEPDDISAELVERFTTVLVHVATERCRQLVSQMGYPGHAIGSGMPKIDINIGVPESPTGGGDLAVKTVRARKTAKGPAE